MEMGVVSPIFGHDCEKPYTFSIFVLFMSSKGMFSQCYITVSNTSKLSTTASALLNDDSSKGFRAHRYVADHSLNIPNLYKPNTISFGSLNYSSTSFTKTLSRILSICSSKFSDSQATCSSHLFFRK